jgi:hypothetical protein
MRRLDVKRPRRRLALLLAVVLGVTLCGCGRAGVTYHSALLRLRVGEYQISPETVAIGAGTIRIELTNGGVLAHQVALAGGTSGSFFEQTATVFPGHTTITRPFTIAAGRYRMYDPGANYADLGAYGTLTVRADNPSG